MNWIGDQTELWRANRHIERPRSGFSWTAPAMSFRHSTIFALSGLSPCAHFVVACLGLIAFFMGFSYTPDGAHARATNAYPRISGSSTEMRLCSCSATCWHWAFRIVYLQPRLPSCAHSVRSPPTT